MVSNICVFNDNYVSKGNQIAGGLKNLMDNYDRMIMSTSSHFCFLFNDKIKLYFSLSFINPSCRISGEVKLPQDTIRPEYDKV